MLNCAYLLEARWDAFEAGAGPEPFAPRPSTLKRCHYSILKTSFEEAMDCATVEEAADRFKREIAWLKRGFLSMASLMAILRRIDSGAYLDHDYDYERKTEPMTNEKLDEILREA